MGWGRPASCACGECRKCKQRVYMRQWYASKTFEERRQMRERRDMELVRQRDRERYGRLKGRDEQYDLRRAAQWTVSNALRDGRLRRDPCERCGTTERVQGHHRDYGQPLVVQWLCTRCHADEHRVEAA